MCQFLQKCLLGFGGDCIDSIDQFGENWNLNDNESSNPILTILDLGRREDKPLSIYVIILLEALRSFFFFLKQSSPANL